jgi:Zn-dependent protease with chaperone function
VKNAKSAFAAELEHPDLGEARAPGQIVFDGWVLRFQAQTFRVDLPLVRLQIEEEEQSQGLIFTDPQQPGFQVHTADPAILEHPTLLRQANTRNQISAMRSYPELVRRLKLTLIFLGGCAGLVLVVWFLSGYMVRAIVAKIPPEWEREVGNAVLMEVREQLSFVDDSNAVAKLEQSMAPLLKQVDTPGLKFQFYVVADQLPNAFALPGGHVIVTSGMLTFFDRQEEIAGVIAHEMAHITQKHGFRKLISQAGPAVILRTFFGSSRGAMAVLAGGSELLVSQSFSQEYELEADAIGWDYLVASGMDPAGYVEGLRKIHGMQMSRPGMRPAIGALSSHPPTEKRLRRLEARLRALKKQGK